jgi:A/G-specific adenine glycosylase
VSDIPKAVPFFDTNMYRVLHRVFFGPDVPAVTAKPKEVTALAASLVPPGRGWAWNQAVMEFGALRCTARRPACPECPLRDHCKARPKMHKALAGLPGAAKNAPGQKYEGTNRYLRGRVLARLREEVAPDGVTVPDLARRLREDAADVQPLRLMAVVESLERDGLARVTRPAERSEGRPAGAVAEERAPYAAGADDGDLAEILPGVRVSLP